MWHKLNSTSPHKISTDSALIIVVGIVVRIYIIVKSIPSVNVKAGILAIRNTNNCKQESEDECFFYIMFLNANKYMALLKRKFKFS